MSDLITTSITQSITNTNTNTHQANDDSSTVNNNKTYNDNDSTNKLDTVLMALNPEPNIPKKSKSLAYNYIHIYNITLTSPSH